MEAETRTGLRTRSRARKPLSDRTNTNAHTQPSSQSSSSKPKLSSAFKKSIAGTKPGSESRSSDNFVNHGHDLNPSSPPAPSIVSAPDKLCSADGTGDDVFKGDTVHSRRQNSNKRKSKGKALAISFSSTPMPKTLNKGLKSVEVERMDLRKSLPVPRRKKQCSMSSEEDPDPALQDFIEKQKAYFKEIDEFELPEEEVGSDEELD